MWAYMCMYLQNVSKMTTTTELKLTIVYIKVIGERSMLGCKFAVVFQDKQCVQRENERDMNNFTSYLGQSNCDCQPRDVLYNRLIIADTHIQPHIHNMYILCIIIHIHIYTCVYI